MSSYINQYSKITTKPGANLKNTLISPYSNNAYIMLQNNIFKDNDDDNKQNNIQLFSLLGELNGPCISLYDNNNYNIVKHITLDNSKNNVNNDNNSVIHTSHCFYLNELYIAIYGTNIYIYKIKNDKIILFLQFINLNFQILDMDVSKWMISNNNNKYVEQYIFVFGGPAGAFIYKHDCNNGNNNNEIIQNNNTIKSFKSSEYNISNIALGHIKPIIAIACKDGRCIIMKHHHHHNQVEVVDDDLLTTTSNNNNIIDEFKIYMEKSDGRITDISFNCDDTILAISFWFGQVYVYKCITSPLTTKIMNDGGNNNTNNKIWIQTYCLPSIVLSLHQEKKDNRRFSPSINPTMFSIVRMNDAIDVLFIYQGRFDKWIVVNPLNGIRYDKIEKLIVNGLINEKKKRMLAMAKSQEEEDTETIERVTGFCISNMMKKQKEQNTMMDVIEKDISSNTMIGKQEEESSHFFPLNDETMMEITLICFTNKSLYRFVVCCV